MVRRVGAGLDVTHLPRGPKGAEAWVYRPQPCEERGVTLAEADCGVPSRHVEGDGVRSFWRQGVPELGGDGLGDGRHVPAVVSGTHRREE